ncbi:MAG: MFS transporter [Clostridia bacterium]|nr:MFS transporter [Clostridia bacterium]
MKNKYTVTRIACFVGFVVQAIINNFLPILFVSIQDNYSLDYERLARLIVINFGVQMIIDPLTPKITKLLGYRATAFLSQFSASLGLVLMGILPNVMTDKYLAICVSAVVYACGSGLMEVILSPMVEILPTENQGGSMCILHSFYCWGQAFTVIVTTVLIGTFGRENWNFIPLIWAVIPFVNAFSFLKVPIIEPSPDQRLASLGELLKRPKFLGFMLMMFCAGASEITMAQWASLFAQRGLGVSKTIGDLAGPCAFALFMAAGRVYYGVNAKKLDFKKSMLILSTLATACYLGVAVTKSAVLSLVFCAVCGLAVSIFWPAIYSQGAVDFRDGGMVMYSVFAMCGDIGCATGPWVLGIAADNLGLKTGFGVTAIFPVAMLICTLLAVKLKKTLQKV